RREHLNGGERLASSASLALRPAKGARLSATRGNEMTPERWNAIYDGFKTALSQPSNSRAEFLQSAFPDDTTLREEVSRLLRDAEEAEQSGFLKDPAWIADDRPVFLPNFRHGDSDFSNIQYIGHGGMGVVYKAYQRNLDKYVA